MPSRIVLLEMHVNLYILSPIRLWRATNVEHWVMPLLEGRSVLSKLIWTICVSEYALSWSRCVHSRHDLGQDESVRGCGVLPPALSSQQASFPHWQLRVIRRSRDKFVFMGITCINNGSSGTYLRGLLLRQHPELLLLVCLRPGVQR
jgi:hypothetical protein